MASLQGKHILVVDDEEMIRELVISEFEFNGATCEQASSGREAIERFKEKNFDAVVSDIRMPNGDGLFFLDQIEQKDLDRCTMIFMTGYSDVPLEEFYDRGVEAVIAKPFRLDQLVNTLEMAMNAPRMGWRRAPRLATALNVQVIWPGMPAALQTMTFSIGRGGMFVQSTQVFPKVGAPVNFVLSFHADNRDQTIEGNMVVRWVRTEGQPGRPPGFGCEFEGLSEELMDKIADVAGLARTRAFIPKA